MIMPMMYDWLESFGSNDTSKGATHRELHKPTMGSATPYGGVRHPLQYIVRSLVHPWSEVAERSRQEFGVHFQLGDVYEHRR